MLIRFGTLDYGKEEREALLDLVLEEDPQLSMGKKVYEFETKFAKWLGSKYAVMVNSGTSALITAISAAKTQPPYIESLLTTALTYPAVWNAIEACNLDTEIRDVEDNFVIDACQEGSCEEIEFVEMKFDTDYLLVQLLGKPCGGTEYVNIIIEDASEALGSQLNSQKLGTFGLLGAFSFYVAHQLTTVEGGMVVTDDKELYDICRSIRDNARICTCPVCTLKTIGKCSKRFSYDVVERRWETDIFFGYNFKPTELQGALGCVKMDKLDATISRRHDIYKRYEEEFDTLPEEKGEYIVPIAYPIKVKNPQDAVAKLEKAGIECRGMFPAYSELYKNATRIAKSHILIPLHQNLSDENVEYIIESVKNVKIQTTTNKNATKGRSRERS